MKGEPGRAPFDFNAAGSSRVRPGVCSDRSVRYRARPARPGHAWRGRHRESAANRHRSALTFFGRQHGQEIFVQAGIEARQRIGERVLDLQTCAEKVLAARGPLHAL